jgi:hypothetical protein
MSLGKKELALDYHKKKKKTILDIETLNSLKISYLARLTNIRFHYELMEYDELQINNDIPIDAVKIIIVRCMNLSVKGMNGDDISAQVLVDFGYPKIGEITSQPGLSSTPIIKTSDPGNYKFIPEFNFEHIIKIERNKNIQRHFERKKINIVVQNVKSSFMGLLSTITPLGKVNIPLDSLLLETSIHKVVDVSFFSNIVNGSYKSTQKNWR